MTDNFTFKDAAGTSRTHASTDLSGVHVSHNLSVDEDGNPIFYTGTTVRSSAVSVTGSATAVPASALASRRAMIIYNNGDEAIYLGSSAVTTAAGFPLQPGQSIALEVGELSIYACAAVGPVDIRVMEIA